MITGGLRVSSDFAKAIAMGADAVAVASAAMVAAACQQYRICGTGMCPVGVATQDETLRKRLHIDTAAKRVENYLKCSAEELKTFARITGNADIHGLSVDDLCTDSQEISEHTNIAHAGQSFMPSGIPDRGEASEAKPSAPLHRIDERKNMAGTKYAGTQTEKIWKQRLQGNPRQGISTPTLRQWQKRKGMSRLQACF